MQNIIKLNEKSLVTVKKDNLVKSRVAPFYEAEEATPPPPFEVNSNGSTLS